MFRCIRGHLHRRRESVAPVRYRPVAGGGDHGGVGFRGGYATVTARYDRAAIADQELFECLRQGFDEVLTLADDPQARVVPASFAGHVDEGSRPGQFAKHKNGSVAYS